MSNWFINLIRNLFHGQDELKKEDDWQNGLVPSLPDFRDVQAKDILGAIDLVSLPEEYRIPYLLPIKSQGSKPICVGESCASIKDEKERREKNDTDFDGEWIYNECKKIDNYSGQGTYFRTGLEILRKVGAKPLPTSAVQGDPATFKIGGYARVDCDFESLKRAIYQWGCILMGFYGDGAGWQTAYIKAPKKIEWGHAVMVVGFTRDYIIIQNSWGDDSGDKGYYYMPASYLPFEAWAVLSDIPTELLPDNNTKPKYQFQNDLYQGMNNDEVKILQDCLRFLGCLPKTQVSTGVFGNITRNAVVIFQQRYGIKQTGNVGPITRDKLNEIFK